MNKVLSLVVMAAGQGSRYGGLKQLDTFGKLNLTIAEYTILDAIAVGFNHFVFVVQASMVEVFTERLKKFLPKFCAFDVVVQKNPTEFSSRKKPLGTGQAILCVKDSVFNGNFGVVNADDIYGKDSIESLARFLEKSDVNSSEFVNVGFELKNTLSENGTVSRGVMTVDENGKLLDVNEVTALKLEEGLSIRGINEAGLPVVFSGKELVSMNLWGFTKNVFAMLSEEFDKFLTNINDKERDEFYLPSAINACMNSGKCQVVVARTSSKWCGLTYASDRENLNNILGA